MSRGSIKFIIAVAILLGGGYFGNKWWTNYMVMGKKFSVLLPSKVNLVGIRLAGERIVVSGGTASLVQGGTGEFQGQETKTGNEGEQLGAASGARVPIGALIASMSGDSDSLGELAMKLKGLETEEIPPGGLVWSESNLKKAIDGDPKLKAKLEFDLVTTLSGGPVSELSPMRLSYGIFVEVEIQVKAPVGGTLQQFSSNVIVPFKTHLVTAVGNHKLIREGANGFKDAERVRSVYNEIWATQKAGGVAEDVAASLLDVISHRAKEALQTPVETLLQRVTVIFTEKNITSATKSESQGGGADGTTWMISLEIDKEGRDRLWQYTATYPGCQLLFIVDGVAIAAPFVLQEMKYYTATIHGITEEDLADSALSRIHEQRTDSKK